jgi:hypothetical protein
VDRFQKTKIEFSSDFGAGKLNFGFIIRIAGGAERRRLFLGLMLHLPPFFCKMVLVLN